MQHFFFFIKIGKKWAKMSTNTSCSVKERENYFLYLDPDPGILQNLINSPLTHLSTKFYQRLSVSFLDILGTDRHQRKT